MAALAAACLAIAAPTPTPVSPPLEDTRWNLTAIGTAPVSPSKRPAFLLLRPSEGRRLLGGWTGCHGIKGTYDTFVGRLRLNPSPPPGKACPATLAARETKLLEAMRETAGYRINGNRLELLASNGRFLARFTAAAPP